MSCPEREKNIDTMSLLTMIVRRSFNGTFVMDMAFSEWLQLVLRVIQSLV